MTQTVVGRILSDLITVYLLLLIARAILDFLITANRNFRPTGGAAAVFEIVYTLTDPPLRLLRRLIPPLRIGNVAIDLAFTVLFIVLLVLQGTLARSI